MNKGPSENDKPNPLKELEWLAHFFLQRGHDDTAREILDQLQSLHMRSQEKHSEDWQNGRDMGQPNQ